MLKILMGTMRPSDEKLQTADHYNRNNSQYKAGAIKRVLKNKLCKCISKKNVVYTVNAVETGQR